MAPFLQTPVTKRSHGSGAPPPRRKLFDRKGVFLWFYYRNEAKPPKTLPFSPVLKEFFRLFLDIFFENIFSVFRGTQNSPLSREVKKGIDKPAPMFYNS